MHWKVLIDTEDTVKQNNNNKKNPTTINVLELGIFVHLMMHIWDEK